MLLSSHLSLLHVKSKLLPQNLYFYCLAAIMNNSSGLPKDFPSWDNVPTLGLFVVVDGFPYQL
jgi:hypothetical protein